MRTKRDNKLILIGAIAKSYGVSENCIRRMEADGLLKPAYVAEGSGYRYYDSADIVQIGTVLTLRSFGFTNKDIRGFLQDPADMSALYRKLQDKQQTITNLLHQFDRRVKTEGSYKCEISGSNDFFCFTKEIMMVPRLSAFSEIACEAQFEAINNKLPVDFTQPPLIETASLDYRTYDPATEQRILFHIPLRAPVEGADISFIPKMKTVKVKWSYPGKDYYQIIPVIDRYFELFSLKQAGTLRAAFNMGGHSVRKADISSTVMEIIIPVI